MRTGLRCRAGGEDIVDQYDRLRFRLRARSYCTKRSVQVLTTLLGGENRLPGCIDLFGQQAGNGQTKAACNTGGQEPGLIETAGSSFPYRHWNERQNMRDARHLPQKLFPKLGGEEIGNDTISADLQVEDEPAPIPRIRSESDDMGEPAILYPAANAEVQSFIREGVLADQTTRTG